MMEQPSELALSQRDKLPDALRVLLADYPREAWESHPNFSGLVQFWLERHMMFRKLLGILQTDAQAMLDRQIDPNQYGQRLSQYGGMLLNQLHGHHQIEDHHYFPTLAKLDTRVEPGFGILDKDHHDMDGLLNRFATSANGVLGSIPGDSQARDETGKFHKELIAFGTMLNRHLIDEEELVVPVILKTGGGGLS